MKDRLGIRMKKFPLSEFDKHFHSDHKKINRMLKKSGSKMRVKE